MQLTSLSESELNVSRDEVDTLFGPFVTDTFSEADPAWRKEIQRRQRKISKKYLRQLLFGWMPKHKRSKDTIIEEYTRAWQESEYANYSLNVPPARISPWEWHDRRMFASDVGATRFRQLLLSRVIDRTKPKRVLEVGCGNGINLLMLACKYPDIHFTGVELTAQGHKAATELQKLDVLPQDIQDYAPLPLADPTAFKRIQFIQGTASDLPFENDSFDLVNTVLALEQMEQIRPQALREIARVCRGHTFMIEPFRDVNEHGWPRKNVIRRNYFRGKIDDLRDYGLEPVVATDDFPQEAFLKVCAVLSTKRGAQSAPPL